jgi:two-component system CheB/CheR fusion protein
MLVLSAGHDVQTVHDGATALRVALDYRPNAVLLDIGLPGQHGYEVAKQLRQQPGQEHVLLIAVTGYGRESDRQRSQDEGFDHHLTKPPDFARLRDILANVSEKRA